MPILGKLKNIFSVGSSSSQDGRKKSKFPYIKQESDPNEFWDIVGELGDGAFGKVYKAQQKQRLEYAALKQVDISNETELEDYAVEIDILLQCRHKNVVGLYESYLFGGKLWMFIEFCGLGALDSIMLELEKPLTEPQIQYVCREMCEGLDFLHQNFIIHRDLKAGNVLLTVDGGVRLADFGVSAKNTSLKQKRDSYIGTPYWMAPEVILCETIKDSPYDFRADIWSFGITLIEFSQIEPPNHEMHPMRVVLKIQKSEPPTLKHPHKWSREFNDFISKCLVKDPEKRWTMAELLQHPFIKNVTTNEGIIDLISELRAEITLEEKDIDEDLDALTDPDTATDSDTSSISKMTNESGYVEGSRQEMLADKSNKNEVIGDVELHEQTKPKDSDESPKMDASLTTSDVAKLPLPTSDMSQQRRDSEEFEGVILREKKPKVTLENEKEKPAIAPEDKSDKTPSPEPKLNSAEVNKKKYRSLTKTRKFVVNGEVVTSKVQKFISNDIEEKQKEHKLWKADLRELKVLHRMENRQLQDLEFKSQQAIEEQMKKFEQDELTLRNMYEANIDMLSKQHKQQIDKMLSTHSNEKKSLLKKTKSEQEKELKSFLETLKQDMKWMKQEVDMMPKELRKETLLARKMLKEAEHQEKQQKFVEEQRRQMESLIARLDEQQAEQYALSEKQFLQQKQQIIRAKEEAMWDMEERHMRERHHLLEQLLKNKFILKRSLMMQRHSKESDQVKRINLCKEDELLACHALEWKRLPKILKSDAKTRALMYRESIRISVINITLDEEREKIKKFEELEKKRAKEEHARLKAKHKRQLGELQAKNSNLLKELEQVHTDKQNMLLENEMQKITELSNSYRAELSSWKEELGPKRKKLEELFTAQLIEQEKLLTKRDYQGAQAITTSASVTPILRTKFPQRLFGKIGEQNLPDDSGLSRLNPSRSSKRSSTFGGLADLFKDSSRPSVSSLNETQEARPDRSSAHYQKPSEELQQSIQHDVVVNEQKKIPMLIKEETISLNSGAIEAKNDVISDTCQKETSIKTSNEESDMRIPIVMVTEIDDRDVVPATHKDSHGDRICQIKSSVEDLRSETVNKMDTQRRVTEQMPDVEKSEVPPDAGNAFKPSSKMALSENVKTPEGDDESDIEVLAVTLDSNKNALESHDSLLGKGDTTSEIKQDGQIDLAQLTIEGPEVCEEVNIAEKRLELVVVIEEVKLDNRDLSISENKNEAESSVKGVQGSNVDELLGSDPTTCKDETKQVDEDRKVPPKGQDDRNSSVKSFVEGVKESMIENNIVILETQTFPDKNEKIPDDSDSSESQNILRDIIISSVKAIEESNVAINASEQESEPMTGKKENVSDGEANVSCNVDQTIDAGKAEGTNLDPKDVTLIKVEDADEICGKILEVNCQGEPEVEVVLCQPEEAGVTCGVVSEEFLSSEIDKEDEDDETGLTYEDSDITMEAEETTEQASDVGSSQPENSSSIVGGLLTLPEIKGGRERGNTFNNCEQVACNCSGDFVDSESAMGDNLSVLPISLPETHCLSNDEKLSEGDTHIELTHQMDSNLCTIEDHKVLKDSSLESLSSPNSVHPDTVSKCDKAKPDASPKDNFNKPGTDSNASNGVIDISPQSFGSSVLSYHDKEMTSSRDGHKLVKSPSKSPELHNNIPESVTAEPDLASPCTLSNRPCKGHSILQGDSPHSQGTEASRESSTFKDTPKVSMHRDEESEA